MADIGFKPRLLKGQEDIDKERIQRIVDRIKPPSPLEFLGGAFSGVREFGKFGATTLLSPFFKKESGRPAVETFTPRRAFSGALREAFEKWRAPGIYDLVAKLWSNYALLNYPLIQTCIQRNFKCFPS